MHRQGYIPKYDECKYCKKIAFDSTDYRCKGPCRKLMHYGCGMKIFRDHMRTYFDHDNIYCFSCSIDKHNLFQTNASFKNFKNSMRLSKIDISTSSTKMDVKNQIDTPGPSGISIMNLPKANSSKNSKDSKDSMRPPKTNISTYSTSLTKMDMKNQIDTPGPSGISNMNLPKVNIFTRSISPTKEFLNVENQIEPLSPYKSPNSSKTIFTYYVSPTKTASVAKKLQFRTHIIHDAEEHCNIQKRIIEMESDKKLAEYLQQYLVNQTEMMEQMTNNFNSLKLRRTEMENQVHDIKNLQLDALKEIKAQYQMINNQLNEVQKEIKGMRDQVSCSKTEKIEFV